MSIDLSSPKPISSPRKSTDRLARRPLGADAEIVLRQLELGDRMRRQMARAAKNNNVELVERLVDVGGDPHMTNAAGDSLLVQFTKTNNLPMLDVLMPYMGVDDVKQAIMKSAATINVRTLETLCAHPAIDMDPNVQLNDKGQTPLMFVAALGQPSTVKDMLAIPGIAIDAQDHRGKTPLMFAAQWKREAVAQELLAHGADPLLLNDEYQKASEVAGSHKVARLLRQAEKRGAPLQKPLTVHEHPAYTAARQDKTVKPAPETVYEDKSYQTLMEKTVQRRPSDDAKSFAQPEGEQPSQRRAAKSTQSFNAANNAAKKRTKPSLPN